MKAVEVKRFMVRGSSSLYTKTDTADVPSSCRRIVDNRVRCKPRVGRVQEPGALPESMGTFSFPTHTRTHARTRTRTHARTRARAHTHTQCSRSIQFGRNEKSACTASTAPVMIKVNRGKPRSAKKRKAMQRRKIMKDMNKILKDVQVGPPVHWSVLFDTFQRVRELFSSVRHSRVSTALSPAC